jgi:hypothetical protein
LSHFRIRKQWARFQALHNRHRGAVCVVCGLGPSVQGWEPPDGLITIGVNDIGRHFIPDYVLVIDRPKTFLKWLPDPRLDYIAKTRPKRAFLAVANTHEQWLEYHHDAIQFLVTWIPKERRKFPPWHDRGTPQLHHSVGGSPLAACSLAGFMGFRRIGLLGVDLYTHHAFKDALEDSRDIWGRYSQYLAGRNIELVNLSPQSALTNLPPMTLEEFHDSHAPKVRQGDLHAQANTTTDGP